MKTLKQLLLEKSEDGRYSTTRQEAIDCVIQWLEERHKEWQGESAPYDEIGKLLEELKQ